MFSQASVSYSVHKGVEWVAMSGRGVLTPGHMGPGILRGTVNKRAVRILLEYILV